MISIEHLVRMSEAIVLGHFRDKAGVQLRLDGMTQSVPALIYRFDRTSVLRESADAILTRFNVGEASLEHQIRAARGMAEERPPLQYPGVNFEEVGGEVVLFLRPAGKELGIDYVFTAQGAADDPSRHANLSQIIDQYPYDPDFDPRDTGPKKVAVEVRAGSVTTEEEMIPLFMQAGIRHFGDLSKGPILDFTVHLDGQKFYTKNVDSTAPRYASGFTNLFVSRGHHAITIVSKALNKRWEREINTSKPTWIVLTYDYYGPEHPQRIREGFSFDVYDHEVYPR